MTKNTLLITLILMVGALLGVVAYLLVVGNPSLSGFREKTDSKEIHTASSSEEEKDATTKNQEHSKEQTQNADQPAQDTQAASVNDETCKEEAQAEYEGEEYQKGSLLVSFPDDTTYLDAQAVITSYGDISAKKGDSAESNYETYTFLEVSVPEGREFDWLCRLRGDSEVKNTSLNTIFELHR